MDGNYLINYNLLIEIQIWVQTKNIVEMGSHNEATDITTKQWY